MLCFYHSQRDSLVSSSESSAILMCNCLVCICHQCFLEKRPANYSLQQSGMQRFDLRCDKCSTNLLPLASNMVYDVELAKKSEQLLITRALAHAGMQVVPEEASFRFDVLEPCLTNLNSSCKASALPQKETDLMKCYGTYDRAVIRLRYAIADLAHKSFPEMNLLHPLQILAVARHIAHEKYLHELAATQDTSARVTMLTKYTECCMCNQHIEAGHSVQLTCACEVNLCRNCALSGIVNQSDSFRAGVDCPQCKQTSLGTLGNVEYTQECETELVGSAEAYLTSMMVALPSAQGNVARNKYIRAIRLYACLGYKGGFDITDVQLRKTTSALQLRLEVARLEERRLNEAGLLSTYSINSTSHSAIKRKRGRRGKRMYSVGAADTQIGFLHALQVKKNVFFEHFFLDQPADNVMLPTTALDALGAKAASICANLQWLKKDVSSYTLMEKCIVLALLMSVSEDYSSASEATHHCSVTFRSWFELVCLVERYLNKLGSCYFKGNDLHGFVDPVIVKLNAESMAVLSRLQFEGVVCSQMSADKQVFFALGKWQLVTASLDPVMQRHLDFYLAVTSTTVAKPTQTVTTLGVRCRPHESSWAADVTEEGEVEDCIANTAESEVVSDDENTESPTEYGAQARKRVRHGICNIASDIGVPMDRHASASSFTAHISNNNTQSMPSAIHTPIAVTASINKIESMLYEVIAENARLRQALQNSEASREQNVTQLFETNLQLSSALRTAQSKCMDAVEQNGWLQAQSEEHGGSGGRVQALEKKLFALKRERSEVKAAHDVLQRENDALKAENIMLRAEKQHS